MSALATLFPEPIVVTTRLGEFPVSPITVGRLAAFSRAVAPFIGQLGDPAKSFANAQGALLPLLAEHGDAVLDAVAIGANLKREQVDGLLTDDAIALAGAVLEANLDFFMAQVVPRLQSVAGAVAKTRGALSVENS
jgi:hypothetical protein